MLKQIIVGGMIEALTPFWGSTSTAARRQGLNTVWGTVSLWELLEVEEQGNPLLLAGGFTGGQRVSGPCPSENAACP